MRCPTRVTSVRRPPSGPTTISHSPEPTGSVLPVPALGGEHHGGDEPREQVHPGRDGEHDEQGLVHGHEIDALTEQGGQRPAAPVGADDDQPQPRAQHPDRAQDQQRPEDAQQQDRRTGLPVGAVSAVVAQEPPAGARDLQYRHGDQEDAHDDVPAQQPADVDQRHQLDDDQREQQQPRPGGQLRVAGRTRGAADGRIGPVPATQRLVEHVVDDLDTHGSTLHRGILPARPVRSL